MASKVEPHLSPGAAGAVLPSPDDGRGVLPDVAGAVLAFGKELSSGAAMRQAEEGVCVLSDDLLSSILSKVFQSTGRLWHALTCEKWASLSLSLPTAVRVRGSALMSEGVLLQSLRTLGHVSSLNLEHHSLGRITEPFIMGALPQLQPSLERISISRGVARAGSISPQAFEHIFRMRNSLKVIKVLGSFQRQTECDLPHEVCSMTSLQVLHLWCSQDLYKLGDHLNIKSLPPGIGALKQLRSLRLHSDNIESLPDSFPELTSLKRLTLRFARLQRLPPHFCNLISLTSFHLDSYKITELPDTLVQLPSLKVHGLACSALTALPQALHCLRVLMSLRVDSCDHLQQLPLGLRTMSSLTHLSAAAALGPFDLEHTSSLRRLSISWGFQYELPFQVSLHLPRLRSLSISSHRIETFTPHLGLLNLLEDLRLQCHSLRQLPDSIGRLSNLKRLSLSSCSKLQTLPRSFSQLRSLRVMSVDHSGLVMFPPSSLTSLTELKMENLEDLNVRAMLASADGAARLQVLEIVRFHHVRTLPESLGLFPCLWRLRIKSCHELNALPEGIGGLCTLRDLEIQGLFSGDIFKIPDGLGRLSSLESLRITNCAWLEELPQALSQLHALRNLTLKYLRDLVLLPDFSSKMTRLQKLSIVSCSSLGQIPQSIGFLQSLSSLELRDLRSVAHLPESISRLGQLRSLDLQGFLQLDCLPASLGFLTGLQRLVLDNIPKLRALPLSKSLLTNLVDLQVTACRNMDDDGLQEIQASLPNCVVMWSINE